MSRLYDTVEPTVISDAMLKAAIEDQGLQEEAANIVRKEGMFYEEIKSLKLDFKNILRIENLWQFESLAVLQLDNNVIEKIEGIENLKNLVWLDLSFNNIGKIEGLENNKKLKDLSLFNNQIKKIENVGFLQQLEVFSIGNNQLSDISDVLCLRPLKNLKTICLKGNPICEKDDYVPFVSVHLNQIVYLDYRLVDPNIRTESMKKYEIDIGQLISNEEAEAKVRQEKELDQQEIQFDKEAYIEGLNSEELFLSLFAEDQEGQKLHMIPGAETFLTEYHDKFLLICKEIYEFGKKQKEMRDKEASDFWACFNEAKKLNTEESALAIKSFSDIKKKMIDDVNSGGHDQSMQETKLNEYNEEVTKLWEKLMALEVLMVDQLEEIIRDFERNMSEMVNNFVEEIQSHFSQMRDLENIQFERLQDVCLNTLEKVMKGEVSDDFPDALRDLLIDKDTIVNALQTSHDLHLLKIDQREDDMISKIKSWLSNLIEQIHDEEEYKRNRKRVMEINKKIDYFRDEIYEPTDLQD